MQLPDFLTADDGGLIQVKGHRIGLNHLVRNYNEGYSAEMLQANYPTLKLSVIHKVIAFYLENEEEVNHYLAEHDREMERQMAAAKPHPTLADLRKRLEAQRRAEVRAGGPSKSGS